jgi:TIR domain/Pentapeptide repeats (8 copies)
MANEEHLARLMQGVEAWNNWWYKNPTSNPDLSNANLRSAFLRGADLSRANLIYANFSDANLNGADLSYSLLRGADLIEAQLYYAAFTSTSLEDTDFTNVKLGGTIFADTDLSVAKGLDLVEHGGPSHLSTGTLYKSAGNIPESFLRGCGLSDWEIESAKLYRQDLSPSQITDILYRVNELRTNPAIQFNSCFISYSSLDQKFAEKLYANLQKKGVRCWFAPEHMKIGDRIRDRIDEAIHLQNRLLLVLSAGSIESQWVEQEVETALEKERIEKQTILCPIRLDETVMNTNAGWASFIRKTRHIGDFSGWDEPDSYQKAFVRLLRDLKA